MEISNVELPPVLTGTPSAGPKSKDSKPANRPNSFDMISATFEHTEINIDFTVYTDNGRLENIQRRDSSGEIESLNRDNAEIVQLRESIRNEILEQVKSFLGLFFEKSPEAVEQVVRGEIPEYFNVENTARRILNIYFSQYKEGEDKEAFAERAKSIIVQAYGDVVGIVGDLPEIVLETRSKVMQILEEFANGGDISGFMQTINN